jgi:hypothetical protein
MLEINANNTLTNAQFEVFSATGNLLEKTTQTIVSGRSQIALQSKLETGLYFLQITEGTGKKHIFKIISK